jgi:predicted NBD/HSP70 family sugar kinase
MIRIGVDIGGTKMEIAAIDESGAELLRRRAPAPQGGYAEAIGAIVQFVLEAEREVGVHCTVGIGTPGAVSRESGRLKNAYASALNGMPVKPDLERRLGREVRFANDANCFALSEAIDGAAKGAQVVFGVILGTGVGGGVVVERHAIEGANSIGGEWGHNALPWPTPGELPGPRCGCGRDGCIEAFLSGPGLARDHRIATAESREPADIAALAESGDRGCVATFERYEERLARALASVINLLDPEVIVLGGGLSNTDRLYRNVPARWSRHVYSDTVVTRLVKAAHGDASGVRGAARLW